MSRKKSTKGRYNFLIEQEIYDKFSTICDELGLVRSRNLERYMQGFIEHNKSVLDSKDTSNEAFDTDSGGGF